MKAAPGYRPASDKGEGANGDPRPSPRYLEIDTGAGHRRWGALGWALLFLLVGGLLVVLFLRFTASLRLALGLVVFLMGYMLLMGWWASRNLNGPGGP